MMGTHKSNIWFVWLGQQVTKLWLAVKNKAVKAGMCNPRPAGHNPAPKGNRCGPRWWQDRFLFLPSMQKSAEVRVDHPT